jgi:hypothetical protein
MTRKKKKTSATLTQSKASSSSSSSSAPASTALQVPTKTTRGSIVWDEERCRIVYESSVQVQVPSTSTAASIALDKNDNANDNDNDIIDNDDDDSADDVTGFWETSYDRSNDDNAEAPCLRARVSTEKPDDLSYFPMHQELNADVDADALQPVITGTTRSTRGKRSYASRKRVQLQSPPLTDALLDVHVQARPRRLSKRTKIILDGDSSESSMPRSQGSASHEEEEHLEELRTPSEATESSEAQSSSTKLEPSSVFDFDHDDIEGETVKARPVRTKRTRTAVAQQPSSKTSLEKARCFFEQLDEREQLTLDHSRTPVETTGKACIRTSRRLAPHVVADPSVHKEYNEYVKACQESGMAPRPVESTFFRTTVIYDGFLDE